MHFIQPCKSNHTKSFLHILEKISLAFSIYSHFLEISNHIFLQCNGALKQKIFETWVKFNYKVAG